ncbi:MAG: TIGR03013 family PEP-CTERM/XrtA system glycosyltransferase [Gammaproteobacteria bacterium]|nr:TIGR03013 family PEP-CTERM/XrtA system glycosyltransferase [Gammaproteobacteria bacterium]
MSVRFFKHYFNVPFLLLGLGEALVFILSVYFAVAYCSLSNVCGMTNSSHLMPQAFVFSAVMLLSLLAMGLYQARLEGYTYIIARIVMGFVVGGGVILALTTAFSMIHLNLQSTLFLLLISFLSVCLLRFLFVHTVDTRLLKRRVLVYGAGRKADAILARFQNKIDKRGFEFVGFIHTDGDPDSSPNKRILRPNKPLCEFARELGVDELVDAIDDRRSKLPLRELLDCKAHGINVINLLSFFERESGYVNVNLLDPSWIIFSDGFKQTALKSLIKRGLDIVISLVLLAVSWPIILLVALAIWLESDCKGPIFYKQIRVGQKGREFKIYKFRSMRTDAEKEGKAIWASKNDSRITRVGKFIRKTRMDELPQIYNVLKGNMSFVGPRPERPEFDSVLRDKIAYYDQRNQIKPGLTGWAQLCYPYGATDQDALEKLQYDLYYVKNQSIFLDLIIIFRTFEVILFGKGAR